MLRAVKSVLVLFAVLWVAEGLRNPYHVLGLGRSASMREIRKAYKVLVREWHPDKNKDLAAEDRFVELNQAYTLLSDPEKRMKFDLHGVTEDVSPKDLPKRSFGLYRDISPLSDIKFDDWDIFHQYSVTHRVFDKKLIPKSYRIPQLILFYSDRSVECLQVKSTFYWMIRELEPIGFDIATVHSGSERLLMQRIGTYNVPSLLLVMDGTVNIYKDSLMTLQEILVFIRNKLPADLVQPVNDYNVNTFLNGWIDNKVRALVFHQQELVKLRYLLAAFYHRDRVTFGFSLLNCSSTKKLQKNYVVLDNSESLLLFNENTEYPVAGISMPNIPVKMIQSIISRNKFLILPRLASQDVFEALCPPEWILVRKRLCVVLVAKNSQYHDDSQQAFRRFAENTPISDRVRFAYIFKEKQADFISSLGGENSPIESVSHVVIIWRTDRNRVKYKWLPDVWRYVNDEKWNTTRDHLYTNIIQLLHSTEELSNEAIIKELVDEDAPSFVSRTLHSLLRIISLVKSRLTISELLISSLSVASFIFLGGYGITLARQEKEHIERNSNEGKRTIRYKQNSNRNVGNWKPEAQLRIHELRAETYNGMVRLLKPGCRSIVLLVDAKACFQLVNDFFKIGWPYRRNKRLIFGFLSIDQSLDWYKRLLNLSLYEPRELVINPHNCSGTVLSLNGYSKYFCVYHPKHTECCKKNDFKIMQNFTGECDDMVSQQECGENNAASVLSLSNVLKDLPNWLEQLFEGTTKRYYINYWPDFKPK